MRLSRDKINKLAHTIADTLADMDQVEFVEDRNTIRMEARRILEELLPQKPRSISPPGKKSKASAAPSLKAAKSGTSFTGSITTRKSKSWVSRAIPERHI